MNPLVRIDRAIIEHIYEPISYISELYLGINNFMIARFLLAVWPAGWGGYAMGTGKPLHYTIAVVLFMISLISYAFLVRAERLVRDGRANPEKYWPGLIATRLSLTLLTALLLASGKLSPIVIATMAYWLSVYFSACDPMPPSFREKLLERIPGLVRD